MREVYTKLPGVCSCGNDGLPVCAIEYDIPTSPFGEDVW